SRLSGSSRTRSPESMTGLAAASIAVGTLGSPVQLIRDINVSDRFRRVGPSSGFRVGPGLIERRLHPAVDRVELLSGRQLMIDRVGPNELNRITVAETRDLFSGSVGDLVALEVTVVAVGLGFDQRRSVPAP